MLLFVVIAVIGQNHNALDRFALGYDTSYVRSIVEQQLSAKPILGNWNTPLQGMGSVYFFNSTMMVTYLAPVWVLGGLSVIGVLWAASSLLLIAGYFCGKFFGAGRLLSVLGRWSVAVLAMLIVDTPALFWTMQLAPHITETVFLSAASICLFARVGTTGWLRSVIALSVIGVLSVIVAYTNFLTVIIPAVFMTVSFVAMTVLGRDAGVRRWRIWGILGLAVFFVICGMPMFVLGSYLNTAASVLSNEMTSSQQTLHFASAIFSWMCGYWIGSLFIGFGIAAAAWFWWRDSGDRRVVSACVAVLGVTYVLLGSFLTRFGWSGPMPIYAEIALYPFYAALIVSAIDRCLRWAKDYAARARPMAVPAALVWAIAIVIFVSPVLLISFSSDREMKRDFPFPPEATPLTRIMAKALALKPDQSFSGYQITINEIHGDDGKNIFTDFMVPLGRQYRNDHRWFGLWHFDIPSLGEYSQLQTPLFFRLANHFLTSPGELRYRNGIIFSRFDAKILRALGTRMVVADSQLPSPLRLVATLGPENEAPGLNLYELDAFNGGDYSPTEVHLATTANGSLERISEIDDLSKEVVVHKDFAEASQLSPAQRTSLIFDDPGWRITAESDGVSLIVLPLQFSSCLRLEGDANNARLMRVNLSQTGLLFEGSVTVKMRSDYGLLNNPSCKLIDWWDARNLAVAFPWSAAH